MSILNEDRATELLDAVILMLGKAVQGRSGFVAVGVVSVWVAMLNLDTIALIAIRCNP